MVSPSRFGADDEGVDANWRARGGERERVRALVMPTTGALCRQRGTRIMRLASEVSRHARIAESVEDGKFDTIQAPHILLPHHGIPGRLGLLNLISCFPTIGVPDSSYLS